MGEVDELVGLAAQLVGDHRRLDGDRRHHRDLDAAALQRLDEVAEIAVAGEQHDVVDARREFHRVDRQLDVHVALDLPTAGRIGELLRRLGDDREAIVVEPVDQRPDG